MWLLASHLRYVTHDDIAGVADISRRTLSLLTGLNRQNFILCLNFHFLCLVYSEFMYRV